MISKSTSFLAAAGAALTLLVAGPASSPGQAGADADSIDKLVGEISAQQAKIIENQTALDEKIGAVTEEVRQARIFVSRGGGKH